MSDNADLSRILQDLASGTIDTDEAQRRIAALTPSTAQADAPTPAQPMTGEPFEAFDPPQASDRSADEPSPQATRASTADESDEQGEPEASEQTARRSEDDMSRPAFADFIRDTFQRVAEVAAGAADAVVTAATNATQHDQAEKQPTGGATSADPRVGGKGVERVVVNAVGRRVRLIGDPAIPTAVVEGKHTMRRSGNTIEITSEGYLAPNIDGVSITHPPRSLDDLKGFGLGKTLTVRVNPAIVVDAEVTAGALSSKKLPRLGKIRVTAGGAKLVDVVEVADALIQAGNATLAGPIGVGRSRVRVESGNLFVNLSPQANVSVKADSNLGLITWPGENSGQFDEYIVGNGAGRLDIGVVVGHASVRVKDDLEAAKPQAETE